MNSRNDSLSGSSIPQPSKNGSPTKGRHLADLSAAATNSRSHAMAPPAKVPRKTLKDRAEEFPNAKQGPPSFAPGSAYMNGSTRIGPPRNVSLSSSLSSNSRPHSSASSRTFSNTSYSSSVGPGSRPPTLNPNRSISSLNGSRNQKAAHGRSASALESHNEKSLNDQVLGKRKGMPPLSSSFPESPNEMRSPRIRGSYNSSSVPLRKPQSMRSLRELSISTRMGDLTLEEKPRKLCPLEEDKPGTPFSSLPRLVPSPVKSTSSSPIKSPRKTRSHAAFLNKSTNVTAAFNIDQKWEEMESFRDQITEHTKARMEEHNTLKESMMFYKSMIKDLESMRDELSASNRKLQKELDESRARIQNVIETSDEQRRLQSNQLDNSLRDHRREIDRLEHERESETRRLIREHDEGTEKLHQEFESQLAAERRRHQEEIETLNNEGTHQQREIEKELDAQLSALKTIEDDIDRYKSEISREQDANHALKNQLADSSRRESDLERSVQRLEGHIQFLESDNKSQSHAFADLEARMQKAIRESEEAKAKLIVEETLRRKLHNQVQELKGNIRVFCRVRPALESDGDDPKAGMTYPDQEIDAKELQVMGPEVKSSLGTDMTKPHPFSFDRVFGPSSQNKDVFGEISQLVQSALDGYNVCIFCYGQTGSGKTYTMSSADGMIPLAVNQIYSTAKSLEEKGWKYNMAGSFVEVYNENLNDLLGKAEDFDKKKHEIRHNTQTCKTEITGIRTVKLDGPERVEEILRNANRNRTVAATQANERSSRSHSVFILHLNGTNSITGEVSEGTLNLVDLAGSERLSHSGATGERLKETQSINKSLSCLGDVIGALGQGKEGGHIPYRNSKLTYLLQFSLGGNSKTLMFVMISPLQAHLQETLTSLKFATKVHNTHIGTAKKQSKVKE